MAGLRGVVRRMGLPTALRAWLLPYALGGVSLVVAGWGLPEVLVRPRFGLPVFTERGAAVRAEVQGLWPWTSAGPETQAHVHAIPSPRRPLRVVHIADLASLGTEGHMDQFALEMQLLGPDLILATGDIVYVETEAWVRWLQGRLEATGAPVIAVAGNHERKDWPLWLRTFGSTNNHAVDVGAMVVLSLDSKHGRDAFTPSQMAWLERQLRAAQGKTILIQAHHPIFPAGTEGRGEGHGSGGNLKGFQRRFVELCRQHQVTAVLSGHWHQDAVFDASGRLREDTPDFPGPKFITTTCLATEARLVTRWPHRHQGYRVLDFVDGKLVRHTSDPEGQGRNLPLWSQTLGRIQRLDTLDGQGRLLRAEVRNASDLHLRGRLKAGTLDFPVDIPPRSSRTYPEVVQ